MMSKQDMDAINSGEKSDHDLISTEMLEDICDGSQTHTNINKRESLYKIWNRIRQRQLEWKVAFKNLREAWENLVQKFPISFQNIETLLK